MFIICYYGSSGDGYVGYDNKPCNSVDYAMQFYTKEDAENKRGELQNEWGSKLYVCKIKEGRYA